MSSTLFDMEDDDLTCHEEGGHKAVAWKAMESERHNNEDAGPEEEVEDDDVFGLLCPPPPIMFSRTSSLMSDLTELSRDLDVSSPPTGGGLAVSPYTSFFTSCSPQDSLAGASLIATFDTLVAASPASLQVLTSSCPCSSHTHPQPPLRRPSSRPASTRPRTKDREPDLPCLKRSRSVGYDDHREAAVALPQHFLYQSKEEAAQVIQKEIAKEQQQYALPMSYLQELREQPSTRGRRDACIQWISKVCHGQPPCRISNRSLRRWMMICV